MAKNNYIYLQCYPRKINRERSKRLTSCMNRLYRSRPSRRTLSSVLFVHVMCAARRTCNDFRRTILFHLSTRVDIVSINGKDCVRQALAVTCLEIQNEK